MEMCYDGALVMPQNFSVVTADEMEYIDGGISVSLKWYGVAIHYSARDLQAYYYALAAGGAVAWIAAELGAPSIVGGLTCGAIAAALAAAALTVQFINWVSEGKGITQHYLGIGPVCWFTCG